MLGVARDSFAASDVAYRGLAIVKARNNNFCSIRRNSQNPDSASSFYLHSVKSIYASVLLGA
jgi:hypothetical protein